jgi:nicotinamide-nucleotide amidase
VSAAGAQLLASSCRERFDADFALAITDCTHTDFRENVPTAPLVYLALADRETAIARELNVAGDPGILKSRIAKAALNLLRLKLLRE